MKTFGSSKSWLPLLSLITHCLANVHPRKDGFTYVPRGHEIFSLAARQDDGTTLDSGCVYACEVSSCGDSCAPAVTKRDITATESQERLRRWLEQNSTDGIGLWSHDREHLRHGLDKRVFTYNPTRWTQARVASYLRQQIKVNDDGDIQDSSDPQFTENLGFFNGGNDQGTRSQQDQFGGNVIQYGTGGLHGCTMVAVISDRGVYMAHFWEKYTNPDLDDDVQAGSVGLTNWQTKVLNAISGQGNQDPLTQGPALNAGLFNQPGDNTFIAIMTPLADEESSERNNDNIKYPSKVNLMIQTIQGLIGGNAGVEIKGYVRLNYSYRNGRYTGPDANNVDKSERGICLFQYDGTGLYRLFYQQAMYSN